MSLERTYVRPCSVLWPTQGARSCPIGDDHLRLIALRRRLGDVDGSFFKLNGTALTRSRALHLVVRPRLDAVLRTMPSRGAIAPSTA